MQPLLTTDLGTPTALGLSNMQTLVNTQPWRNGADSRCSFQQRRLKWMWRSTSRQVIRTEGSKETNQHVSNRYWCIWMGHSACTNTHQSQCGLDSHIFVAICSNPQLQPLWSKQNVYLYRNHYSQHDSNPIAHSMIKDPSELLSEFLSHNLEG